MLRNQIQLIAYPNRMGTSIRDLHALMNGVFKGAFGGVHLLPMYPSNADGGFSPLTHKEVDPAYGTWEDIESLAAEYDLCVDLVLNHISDQSPQFLDFVAKGYRSEFADLFVHIHEFGEITPDDLARIHIRKEKEPFRDVQFADGRCGQVWCTFTEHQIDLNYSKAKTHELIREDIEFLCARGVKLFRLDAFGYTTKKIGTSCFMVEPDVYGILEGVRDIARDNGAFVLPEVHDHPSYQTAIARRGMYAYGFALPLLVLYSLFDANSTHLKNWLRMCPENQVTVLDTHDGICIPDVEDLLPHDRIQAVIDNVSQRSSDPILRRTAANVHSVGAIYQLTCTFYDALKGNDDAYIAARAIQFFAPGIPQVYYVGLLAGGNDETLMEATGELRDINRHVFSRDEVAEAVQKPVVQRLLNLMRFRNGYPAFQGQFELCYSNDSSLALRWVKARYRAELFLDLNFKTVRITYWDASSDQYLTMDC